MSLIKWGPLRGFDDMFTDYRSVLNRLGQSNPEITGSELRWRPVADISETKKEYLVKVELPEVDRDDVSVTVEDGMLRIEGKREWKKTTEDEKQHRTESFYGSFERSFSIPENVSEADIRAESKDGVLTVHLPKDDSRKSETRKIAVK